MEEPATDLVEATVEYRGKGVFEVLYVDDTTLRVNGYALFSPTYCLCVSSFTTKHKKIVGLALHHASLVFKKYIHLTSMLSMLSGNGARL